MHGRLKVKEPAVIAEAKRKERLEKQRKYNALTKMVLANKAEKVYTNSALKLSEKLLVANPDFYTAWNYRREVLMDWQSGDRISQETGKSFDDVRLEELNLTQLCIQRQPKSYVAWTHRQWTVLFGSKLQTRYKPMLPYKDTCTHPAAGSETTPEDACIVIDWGSELGLCTSFLKLDSRNFHCWDYRRWVVKTATRCGYQFDNSTGGEYLTMKSGCEAEDMDIIARENRKHETAFSAKKIEDNFSNYSSWHYRSKLLPQLYKDGVKADILLNELDMVQQACFTEPEDQSPWLYLRWLLRQRTGNGEDFDNVTSALEEQLSTCRELLELEPDSKWTLLTSIRLMLALGVDKYFEQCIKGLDTLCVIDADRKQYYIDTRTAVVEGQRSQSE